MQAFLQTHKQTDMQADKPDRQTARQMTDGQTDTDR